MLESCEQIVVFMDEFDELVRSRESSQGELESRFLTTAMLPKLAHLSDRRRVVYLLATNHLEEFDVAIRRPGRFDKIYFVLPPKFEAKARKWNVFKNVMATLEPEEAAEIEGSIADLTYAEAESLALVLDAANQADWTEAIGGAHSRSTLQQAVDDEASDPESWKDRIVKETNKTRRL
jgi:SpoVK/Ycf46/Vps4 family AAA+-type ATPase